eukprot:1156888-Pelagomonas_calceolata.AAC.1
MPLCRHRVAAAVTVGEGAGLGSPLAAWLLSKEAVSVTGCMFPAGGGVVQGTSPGDKQAA